MGHQACGETHTAVNCSVKYTYYFIFITIIWNYRTQMECWQIRLIFPVQKYQQNTTWPILDSRGLSFGKCTPCHTQFMSCRSTLVIIQHPPLRVIDKVEWTNTLPKHATSHWASGTVIQNKQGREGGLAARVGDAQLSGGYLCLLLQQSTRI